jgi:hypothetical protein
MDIEADWKVMVEQLLAHRLPDHESIGGVQRFSLPLVQVELELGRVGWRAACGRRKLVGQTPGERGQHARDHRLGTAFHVAQSVGGVEGRRIERAK